MIERALDTVEGLRDSALKYIVTKPQIALERLKIANLIVLMQSVKTGHTYNKERKYDIKEKPKRVGLSNF